MGTSVLLTYKGALHLHRCLGGGSSRERWWWGEGAPHQQLDPKPSALTRPLLLQPCLRSPLPSHSPSSSTAALVSSIKTAHVVNPCLVHSFIFKIQHDVSDSSETVIAISIPSEQNHTW